MVSYKSIIVLICSLLFASVINIQNKKIMIEQNNKYYIEAERFKKELARDEADYKLIFYHKGKINEDDVHIFRFEPQSSKELTLKGPHVTVILDNNNKLKGFARLNEEMAGKAKTDEKEGIRQSLLFLNKYAPDLKDSRYQWTKSHQERVKDSTGKLISINGSWVKYQDKDSGEYLWVILAPDNSIMEFDRDIVWSFFKGGRVNELWLRDDWFEKWLKKNNK